MSVSTKTNKKRFNFTIDPAIKASASKLAFRKEMSLSAFVERAILQEIKRAEKAGAAK